MATAAGAALLLTAAASVPFAGTAQAAETTPKLSTTPYGNLAQALQTAIYFYDAEKSGPARSLGRQPLEWRGDSEPQDSAIPLEFGDVDNSGIVLSGTNLPESYIEKYRSVLDPDGDKTLDLSMGFHDAGDHVKFGLPQGYAASTIGWGVYEFTDAYKKTNAYDHIMDELYWFNDYFLKSTFRDSKGDVVAFAYQLGNGAADHTYWGPPEFQTTPRGALFAYIGNGASDQTSEAAASLAIMSMLTKDSDPTYSKRCLETAMALYRFGVENRGLGLSGGFYGSGYDEDELSWAATWLYVATGEMDYVDDILALKDGKYVGWMGKIIKTPADDWQNSWVHSWDAVWAGVFGVLAPATKGKIDDGLNTDLWYYARWNLEWWSGGAVQHKGGMSGGGFINTSDAGFGVIATWGSARYNTAAQLCALVYRKHSADDPEGGAEHGEKLSQWALGQMNYILGDNPLHRSYEVGYTAKSTDTHAMNPHHRASHGSSTNDMGDPKVQKHTLWGALVGGPDDSDKHNDVTNDYVYNEVAIDYNAGFVGALAGLWHFFGQNQTVTKWTPPLEEPERAFYTLARLTQDDKRSSQITVQINNRISRPPTKIDDLSMRYYFDISELVDRGQDISAVSAELQYDEGWALGDTAKATVSAPVKYGTTGNVYYVELSMKGKAFWGKRDAMIALSSKQDSTWTDRWDPSNDPSHIGLPTSALGEANVTTYRNGVLVDGTEPDGTTPKPTSSTSSSTKTTKTSSSTTTSKSSTKTSTTKSGTCKNTNKCATTTTKSKSSLSTSTCKNTKKCTTKKSSTKKKTTVLKTVCKTKNGKKTCITRTKSAASALCSVDVRVTAAWPGGFQALVTVEENAPTASGWTVRWDAPGVALTQVSGASLIHDGDTALLGSLGSGSSSTVSVVGTTSGAVVPSVSCSA